MIKAMLMCLFLALPVGLASPRPPQFEKCEVGCGAGDWWYSCDGGKTIAAFCSTGNSATGTGSGCTGLDGSSWSEPIPQKCVPSCGR